MSADTNADAGPQAPHDRVEYVERPLFPLHNVLHPAGLLQLKVFEARYLDLMADCLRGGLPFGVVALRKGNEARSAADDGEVELEAVGTLAELIDVDSAESGILHVRCRGTRRFAVHAPSQRANGLWVAQTSLLPEGDDAATAADGDEAAVARRLAEAIDGLKQAGIEPFLEPWRYDSAGWVADRWCELLPLPVATKQRLLEDADGGRRLAFVAALLRREGVIGD